VIDQDIDFTGSPLGRPVHWRIEHRENENINCSTLRMTAEEIRAEYGAAVDSILGSQSKMNVTIENYQSDAWQKTRTPVLDPQTGKVRSFESFKSEFGQGERGAIEELARRRH
jgi:hypothetical protein